MSVTIDSKSYPWFPAQLWVNGVWQTSEVSKPVYNPANHQPIAEVAQADAAMLEAALQVAADAFPAWSRTSAETRAAILRKTATLLNEQRAEFATLLTLEQGKTIRQAEAEVDYAVSFYQWFSEQARRIHTIVKDHPSEGREFFIEKKAIGVAGIITPWNFPLAQGAKKVAASLAAGCTFVWKPAEFTPLVALAMGPLLKEAGLPDGVANIVTARGSVAGPAMARHPAVGVVSLTGSTETGAQVMRDCADQIKRVSLELGGNAPFIVFDDADLDLALQDLIAIKTLTSGQVCVTANRVFLHERIHDQFVERLVEKLRTLHVGDGLDRNCDMGPLIHREAVQGIEAMVEDAVAHGATRRFGAGDLTIHGDTENGSYMTPTLLTGLPEQCRMVKEEIFGPVIACYPFRETEEVIRRANDTEFGLSAYLYSDNYARAKYVAQHLEAGIIGVNEMRPLKAQIPFGGWKRSGIGAEGGEEGLLEFLDTRVIGMPKVRLPE